MIKLYLPEAPEKLTPEKQSELTRLYKEKGYAVWKRCGIPKSLFAASFNKCAFSEIELNTEGKYGEIEHIYPTSLYPEKVVEWGNLIPITNVCNRKKSAIDPEKTPLINPFFDDPKDYLFITDGRLIPKKGSIKAINTIEAYGLNNMQHLRKNRSKVEQNIEKTLADICEYHTINTPLCCIRLKELMNNGARYQEYSATKSTYMLLNSRYQNLKSFLQSINLWDTEFQSLEEELKFCSLPK